MTDIGKDLAHAYDNGVDWAGFEFIGRIQIKDKESGREFK